MTQWLMILTRNREVTGLIPGLDWVLRNWRCLELWCRSHSRLGSLIAVAVVQAGGYSSNLTPRLGTPICPRCNPKKSKKKKKKTL